MELLWLDFLNSHWRDWRGSGRSEDRLEKTEWLNSFIEKWELPFQGPIEAEVIEKLKDLRTYIGEMANALAAGQSFHAEQFVLLNNILKNGPVIFKVTVSEDSSSELSVVPLENNLEQLMARIAASFAETIVKRDSTRIRICENADCLWVFYDDTKNRSKRYCDDKMCGNLMKVRRFRARHKS